MLGAIALGRSIRRLGMTTTVGRTTDLPARRPRDIVAARRLRIHVRFRAARRRQARRAGRSARARASDLARRPPRRRHRRGLFGGRSRASCSATSAGWRNTPPRWAAASNLLEVSLRIPPWEPMRALTRDELRRMRLDNVEVADTRAARDAGRIGRRRPRTTRAQDFACRRARMGDCRTRRRRHAGAASSAHGRGRRNRLVRGHASPAARSRRNMSSPITRRAMPRSAARRPKR